MEGGAKDASAEGGGEAPKKRERKTFVHPPHLKAQPGQTLNPYFDPDKFERIAKARCNNEKNIDWKDSKNLYNKILKTCNDLAMFYDEYKRDYFMMGRVYQKMCRTYNNGYGCFMYGSYLRFQENEPDKAFEYFYRGCQLYDTSSCYNAGCYLNRQGKAKKDNSLMLEAFNCFKQACGRVDPISDSCWMVAMFYHKGEQVKRDLSLATVYGKQACRLGYPDACFYLAHELREGKLFHKDKGLAKVYQRYGLKKKEERIAELVENDEKRKIREEVKLARKNADIHLPDPILKETPKPKDPQPSE